MALDIGRYGIWAFQLDLVPTPTAQEHVARLDELGFGALWIPEAVGREPFTSAGVLLAGSQRIVLATGIASIWARDAMTMNAAQRTLAEAYPDRFLLGMGVSHHTIVTGLRGHDYTKPYTTMKHYLEAMDRSLFLASGPAENPPRVLAALGPKMLRLAAEQANGAHPYFVPPEHTAIARETMGEGALLAVEQAVVFETDPTRAREIARQHTSIYTSQPNYVNNLKRFGLTDDDVAERGGSDKLVDTIVAWGDMDTVLARIKAHHDAGADHVCIQVVPPTATDVPVTEWQDLSAALSLT